jgi:hypothetical protein
MTKTRQKSALCDPRVPWVPRASLGKRRDCRMRLGNARHPAIGRQKTGSGVPAPPPRRSDFFSAAFRNDRAGPIGTRRAAEPTIARSLALSLSALLGIRAQEPALDPFRARTAGFGGTRSVAWSRETP